MMDSLLSVSFHNLSSSDSDRIRRGLKQIDGLLAQICLSTPPSTPRRKTAPSKVAKSLLELHDDPAFAEFFRLQESFEWNVSSQLVETLDRLLSMPAPAPPVIHSTLDTMTALLLLHPPSRVLFARRPALLSLLDLLEPSFLSAFGSYGDGILSNALATLMVAMLDTPRVARTFEKEGLETVLRLAREGGSRGPKAEELLQVWMLPESADADDEPWRSRSPSKSLANSLRQSSMTSTTDHPVGTMRRIHEPLPDFNQLNPNTVRHASQVGEGGSVLSGALSGSLRSPEEKARMLMRAAGGDEPAISDMVADWRATSRTGGVRGLA